jgi:glucokinase
MPILGIDIGGTRLKAGLVDDGGNLSDPVSLKTPANAAEFEQAMRAFVTARPADGVGIGCKGIINAATTRVEVLPGMLHFLEGRLLSEFVDRPVPVRADNDAHAAMAGEAAWGAARDRRHAVMLTLGSGVGGGILSDGRLLRGAAGVAGHLGHLTMDPDGPVCLCGNRGCLETYFSARAIEAEAIAAVLRGSRSYLTDRFASNPIAVTCEDVFLAAAAGDFVACAIRDRAIKYLAGAIAGIFGAFDPEVVILGGQIAAAGPALFDPLQEQVSARARRLVGRETPVVRAEIAEAGIVGAAALVKFG